MNMREDITRQYGAHECNNAALEEAFRLTVIALSLEERSASVWLTREALDLCARITED